MGSSPQETFDALFQPEKSRDAESRNRIREEVRAAFQSVSVWLFEAPTQSVAELRQVLTLSKTTPAFRATLRAFRAALVAQLSEPTALLGDQPLTGRTLHSLMRGVVDTLNRGEAVLPSSAYLAMVREELRAVLVSCERAVRERGRQVGEEVAKDRRWEVETAASRRVSFFLSEVEAVKAFGQAIAPLLEDFQRQLEETCGTPSPSLSLPPHFQSLFQEGLARVREVREEARRVFLVAFLGHFHAFLKGRRQAVEGDIAEDFRRLAEETGEAVNHPLGDFKSLLLAIYEKAVSSLQPPNHYYPPNSDQQKEVDDAVEVVQRFHSSLYKPALQKYEERYHRMQKTANELFKQSCQQMERSIATHLQQLKCDHPQGFTRHDLVRLLDKEFVRLDSFMKEELKKKNGNDDKSPFIGEVHQSFYEFCHNLQQVALKEFETLKQKELVAVYLLSEETLTNEIAALCSQWEEEFQQYNQSLSSSNPDEAVLSHELNSEGVFRALDDLLLKKWRETIASVSGWLSDSLASDKLQDEKYLMQQTPFGKKLYDHLQSSLTPFKDELVVIFKAIQQQREALLEQKRRQAERMEEEEDNEEEEEDEEGVHDNRTVAMEESMEEEEGDEDEDEGEGDDTGDNAVFREAKKASKVSLADQRRKAKEFAERVLGISFTKKKTAARKPAAKAADEEKTTKGRKKTTTQPVAKKSVAKQREDARQFALREFGEKAFEEDEEEEELPNDRRASTTSSSSGRKSTASKRDHQEMEAGEESSLSQRKKVKLSPSPLEKDRRTSAAPVPPAHTTPASAPPVPPQAGKKGKAAPAAVEDPVAAARLAAREEMERREREIIEKATAQIKKRGGKK